MKKFAFHHCTLLSLWKIIARFELLATYPLSTRNIRSWRFIALTPSHSWLLIWMNPGACVSFVTAHSKFAIFFWLINKTMLSFWASSNSSHWRFILISWLIVSRGRLIMTSRLSSSYTLRIWLLIIITSTTTWSEAWLLWVIKVTLISFLASYVICKVY